MKNDQCFKCDDTTEDGAEGCDSCSYESGTFTCESCCSPFFALIDSACSKCSDTLSNCLECDSTATICSACQESFLLDNDGICQDCQTAFPNCIYCSGGTVALGECIQCSPGYFINSKNCALCGNQNLGGI